MGGLFGGIWSVMAGHRGLYGMAVASMVLASALMYLPPVVTQATLDALASGGGASDSPQARLLLWAMGGPEALRGRLWVPGLLIVGFTALAGAFTYLRGRWSALATESIIRRLRDRVYDTLNHLPLSFHDRQEVGDLVQRCTSDVETLRMFLAEHAVEIGRASLMLLLPLPLMLSTSVAMTVTACALLPLIVGFGVVFFLRVRRSFLAKDEAEAALTACVQENITGIRVVRAFNRSDFEREKLARRNEAHRRLDERLYRLLAVFWASSDMLCFVQRGLVIGVGVWSLSRGELTVGEYFFFIAAVELFLWPMRMMGRILTELGKATVAYGRLREVLSAATETEGVMSGGLERGERLTLATSPGDGPPARPPARIVFDGVSFAYPAGERVLHDVSFALEPGRSLALLGPSGAGKTTIVRLLLRLHDPDEGRILIDGTDIATLERREVRRLAATVLQEPFLFSRTIRENIALAGPWAPDEELHEAAQIACIHNAINRFELGYDTVVGERGVTLSGGQRQRIAIARALVPRPPILILDDALSAVDTETEKEILAALRDRRRLQTTILIAHRLSTLVEADETLVLDRGRIVDRGTHAELAARPGLYRRLWTLETDRAGAIEAELADARDHGDPHG